MSGFEIHQDSFGKYRFRLKDNELKTLLHSVGFKSIAQCHNSIDLLKANVTEDRNFERTSIHGGYSFNLCIDGVDPIASGELCGSIQERDRVIAEVKKIISSNTTVGSLN